MSVCRDGRCRRFLTIRIKHDKIDILFRSNNARGLVDRVVRDLYNFFTVEERRSCFPSTTSSYIGNYHVPPQCLIILERTTSITFFLLPPPSYASIPFKSLLKVSSNSLDQLSPPFLHAPSSAPVRPFTVFFCRIRIDFAFVLLFCDAVADARAITD